MPDFDNLHTQLPGPLRSIYEELCEGRIDQALPRRTSGKLRPVLNRYGDEPLKLIRRVARKLAPLQAKPLPAKATDWDALSQDIDQAAKRCKGSKRGMGLAVRAAKRLAYDVRSGNSYTTLDEELTTRYMASVLDADFVDRTASLQPANGISPVVVRERLMELRERIVEELKYFAKQAMRKGTFQSLRLRRRKAIKPVDLDEDLHAIG